MKENISPLTDIHKGAEQGDADAQFNLGVMYEFGEGVPHDDVEAVKWYRKVGPAGVRSCPVLFG